MKNYCSRIKTEVKKYYDYKMKKLEEMDRNRETYSPAKAGEMNTAILDKLNDVAVERIEAINKIFIQARTALGDADLRRGEELADPDIATLNDPVLKPSIYDLRSFIDKHSKNFTALKYLKTWLEARNESIEYTELAEHFLVPYEAALKCREYAEMAIKKISLMVSARETWEMSVENFLEDLWTANLVAAISSVDLDITKPIPESKYKPFEALELIPLNFSYSENIRRGIPFLNGQTV